ncbi:MAG TPA: hypothetical protein VK178_05905 [Opitutaceae bacterium]|nr:hypothetical protein [Opitutaceae bacterium]
MKRFLAVALLISGPLLLAEEEAKPSPRQQVIARMPAYSNEEHERLVAEQEALAKAQAEAKAAAEADPDLVVLQPMTVIERAMQKMEEDSLYMKGAFDKELVKRELTALDRYLLNRFTIPFLGISKEARARDAYLTRRNAELQDRLTRLNRMVALIDPEEAREFRDDLRNASLDNTNTAKEAARSTSAKGGSGGKDSQ